MLRVACSGVAIRSSSLHAEGSPEATFTVRVGCHIDCEWQARSWLWLESTARSRLCMTQLCSLTVGKTYHTCCLLKCWRLCFQSNTNKVTRLHSLSRLLKWTSTCLTWRWGGISQAHSSLNSPFLVELPGCRGRLLYAQYNQSFRKSFSLNVRIIFSRRINHGVLQRNEGRHFAFFFYTKILYERAQVFPVPKNLQIT